MKITTVVMRVAKEKFGNGLTLGKNYDIILKGKLTAVDTTEMHGEIRMECFGVAISET